MRRYVLAAMALLLMPFPCSAADLTIRFTGSFRLGTCNFSIPDTDLGTYLTTQFTGATATPWKSFTVTARDCTRDLTTVHMRFEGAADVDNSGYFHAKSNAGDVSGVAIELSDSANAPVRPNGTLDWSLSAGTTYEMRARLQQTRPTVTAGSINTPITVQISYN